jgi:hypothetical protein
VIGVDRRETAQPVSGGVLVLGTAINRGVNEKIGLHPLFNLFIHVQVAIRRGKVNPLWCGK